MSTYLRVEPSSTTVVSGKTVKLEAILNEDHNDFRNISVIWESEDSQIATVNADGRVKGLKPGCTMIKAKAKGEQAMAVIIVNYSSDEEEGKPTPTQKKDDIPSEKRIPERPIADRYVSAQSPHRQIDESQPRTLNLTFLEESDKQPEAEPMVMSRAIGKHFSTATGNTLSASISLSKICQLLSRNPYEVNSDYNDSQRNVK